MGEASKAGCADDFGGRATRCSFELDDVVGLDPEWPIGRSEPDILKWEYIQAL
jgi:hypothetical protein